MLPTAFLDRMARLLGEDYPAFFSALSDGEAVHACRVNGVKLSREEFLSLHPPVGEPIPYTEDGFYYPEEKIGRHPLHHAGAVYSQDPGAMSALAALAVQPGWRVLDACAAPGGKSAQLAAQIGPDGVLVSNEYVPARCKLLVSNIERLGIPHALVLNRDTAALADMFPAYFDLAVVDAPCSGEGMFRKSEDARRMWSEDNVRACAARQGEILAHVAKTVRPGGYLLYSTCTYAPEENEEGVLAFLASHPEFALRPVKESLLPYTAPGVMGDGACMRRFYPHIAPGEGQFVALLQHTGSFCGESTPAYRDAGEPVKKGDIPLFRAFFADVFGDADMAKQLRCLGDKVILPPAIPLPPHGVFAAGVLVGEVRKGVVFPHHQLFSAYGRQFTRQISLLPDDPRVAAYLHGDVIPAAGVANGYASVCIGPCPLGGAKVVDGMAKNLYPKGLRQ